MQIEQRVIDAVMTELNRQATEPARNLSIEVGEPPDIVIHGRVDLDKLAVVIMGTLAGGP